MARSGTAHPERGGGAAAFAALGPAGETPHGVPLFQNSNFTYPDARAAAQAAEGRAFLYGRHGSPTVDALERALADLEGGERGLAFASGMAAITAATLGLALGDGPRAEGGKRAARSWRRRGSTADPPSCCGRSPGNTGWGFGSCPPGTRPRWLRR